MLDRSLLKLLAQPVAGVLVLTAATVVAPQASFAQISCPGAVRTSRLNTNYTLGGGDRIRVAVLEVQELNAGNEYQIPPGGGINLPLIGGVRLQGLTVEEASDLISQRYSRFLKRPLVSVNLLNSRSINVNVAGEVTRPSAYTLSLLGETGLNPGAQSPTVIAAISQAQGVTYSADLTNVQVCRRLGGNQRPELVTLNVRDILRTGNLPFDISLRDGDSIFVPVGGNLSLSEIRQLSYLGIAPAVRPTTVAVTGEVLRPGTYLVNTEAGGVANNAPSNQQVNSGLPTITRAIQLAGGLTSLANIDNVQLRRRSRTGEVITRTLNLRQLLRGGDIDQDTLLQDGDTLVFATRDIDLSDAREISQSNLGTDPTRPVAVAVIGEVNRAGTYLIQPGNDTIAGNAPTIGATLGGGQPTVTRAIQIAGGVTPTANVRDIKIRRNTRNGGEQIISVNLWEVLKSGDIKQDTRLQEGDTIIVTTAADLNTAETTALATTTLSPGRILVSVVGEVKRPGQVELQPNSSLNQALLAAGAFNDARANSSEVELIRLNPDGSVTKRKVKTTFSAGINEDSNPLLRNNDVVVIARSGTTQVGDAVTNVVNPLSAFWGLIRSIFRF